VTSPIPATIAFERILIPTDFSDTSAGAGRRSHRQSRAGLALCVAA
jgi:hypothetical protein